MESREPLSPPVTISTIWLDPRRLVPCNPPRDRAVIETLITVFPNGAGGSVEPILTIPLVPDERKLLVLQGNHRAGAALAADRRLFGKVCRTVEDWRRWGRGHPRSKHADWASPAAATPSARSRCRRAGMPGDSGSSSSRQAFGGKALRKG
jgi:hypothetical protein